MFDMCAMIKGEEKWRRVGEKALRASKTVDSQLIYDCTAGLELDASADPSHPTDDNGTES